MNLIEGLQEELEECRKVWSKYSCDCLHFEMASLEKSIAELIAENEYNKPKTY